MRNVLRNKDKIKNEIGAELLDRIVRSVANLKEPIDRHSNESEPYDQIVINDINHTCGIIVLYVVSEKFDVRVLAFKEFAG